MNKKEAGWGVLVVLFGIGSFLVWQNIPERPLWTLVILLFASVFGLFLLVAKNPWIRYWAPVLSLIAGAFILGGGQLIWLGTVIGICWLCYGIRQTDFQMKNLLSMRVKPVIGKSVRMFFTAFVIIVAFSYYAGVSRHPDPASLLLPKQAVIITMQLFEGLIQGALPGITPRSSVDDAIGSFIKHNKSLRAEVKQNLGVDISKIPPQQLKQLIAMERAQLIQSLQAESIGILGSDNIADVLYRIATLRLQTFMGSNRTYIPALAAISYFFVLKAVSIIFYYLALAIIVILLKTLLELGVLRKELVPAQKEIITYG